MVVFAPFRLDVRDERLWRGSTLLALRRKPFAILCYLVANARRLVTHEELLAHVWKGMVVSESAVRTHVHELRQVLGDGFVETVIGRGYRFVAQVTAEDAPAAEPQPPVAPARRPERPVVCRDGELFVLRAALERALGGHRQVCFVTGEPGIGKTTLVERFLDEVEDRGILAISGHFIEQHGTPEAYLAMIEALGQLLRSERGERALAAFVRHAPTFLAKTPSLVPDAQLAEVSRRAEGGSEARMVRELTEALEASSAQAALVIVLEDLQWSDVATVDFLNLLGQRKELARLLVIGTSRRAEIQSPGHPLNRVMRSLIARSGAVAVQLERLAADGIHQLMAARFPDNAFPAQLIEVIHRATGGTPLFAVAFLDDLVRRGVLAERDGRWELAASLDAVEAHRPDSVKQLIDIGLDRLTVAEQRILEAASVVGAEHTSSLVAAALELSVEQIEDACDALVRRGLFLSRLPTQEQPDGSVDARYAFSHALVQEVCLERTVAARSQRWHRSIAEHIERTCAERIADVAHVLAMHFDRGQLPARAVHYYMVAGHLTALRFASADALVSHERALELLPRIAATRERDVLELRILGIVGQLLIRSKPGRGRDPLGRYHRAIDLARRLDDVPHLYAGLAHLCVHCVIVADYVRATEVGEELEQLAALHPLDHALLEYGTNARAIAAAYRGDLATATRLFDALIASATGGELPPTGDDGPILRSALFGPIARRATATAYRAVLYALTGQPARALRDVRAARDAAALVDDPIALGMTQIMLVRIHLLRRDPPAAVAEAAQAIVESATAGEGIVDEARMVMLWSEQRTTPHEPAVVEALLASYHRRLERVSAATLVGLPLIDLLRTSGDLAAARQTVEAAIGFATTRDERLLLPELLRLRGVLVAAQDPAAAARAYEEAGEFARQLGLLSLELRATTALAAISGRARDRLAELVAGASDGDATPDLVDARAVLARPGPTLTRENG